MKMTTVLTWITMLMILNVASKAKDIHFSIQKYDLCPVSLPYTEFRTQTWVQCSALCLRNFHCIGFCFHPTSYFCRIFDSYLDEAIASAVTDPGFIMYWAEYLDGYYRFGQKAYMLVNRNVDYEIARKGCRARGVHLVLPMNAAEADYIFTANAKKNVYDVWADGQDVAQEGTWISGRTGSPITYIDWFTGEPSNVPTENCMLFIGTKQMADRDCNVLFPYACEKLVYGTY